MEHAPMLDVTMVTFRSRLASSLCLIVSLAYLSLAIWMHIWTLEVGVPKPGESTTPHHQVCTWIGTSGEAGVASFSFPSLPTLIQLDWAPVFFPTFILPTLHSTIQARAPPLSFI